MISKIKSLKQNEGFMKYFKNTSWLFTEKILRITVGLFVGVWVARYLGPEKFGLLSYAQSFVGIFAVIATFGLDVIVVRELVKDEGQKAALIGTAFFLKFIGAFLVLLVLAIAVNFTSNDKETNILIFIISSATIFQSFNVVDFYFQSKVLSKYVVFANMSGLLISSVIKVIFILNEVPLIYFGYLILFDSFVLALGFIYFYWKSNTHSPGDSLSLRDWRFDLNVAKSLLNNGWPLILSGIVISIYMRIDQIMIKEMLDSEAVGQYAAAVRISEMWYFVPILITSSLFPAIINAKNNSESLYYFRLKKLYRLVTAIAFVIILPMTFFSQWVVDLLYGIEFNQAGNILMIHIWAGLFVSVGMVTSKIVVANNKQKEGLKATTIGAFSNILLNYLFIPRYGLPGAAISTMIAQVISGVLVPCYFKIDNKFPMILFRSLCYRRDDLTDFAVSGSSDS